MNRRHLLNGSVGAMATGLVSGNGNVVAAEAGICPRVAKPAIFVLVHGSWVGAWTFKDLDRRLTERGHTVYRPSLSGWGERAHLARPEMNIDTNVEDVCALLAMDELSGIVLVGHSYGGMVITGVADRMPERIASIVYLDAFLPENGKSIADYAGDEWRETCEAALTRGDFLLPLPVVVAGGGDPRITPVPARQQIQRIALTGAYRRVPKKTYVCAALNPAPYFRAFYESVRDDPEWRTYEAPTDHFVYEEAPELTVEILEVSA